MRNSWLFIPLTLALAACAASASQDPPAQVAASSILVRSSPANGSTVAQPVNALTLTFAEPVRLLEVTVEGPDGVSPMMITAAGENTFYSLPLPGLDAGAYRATWKASRAGRTSTGTIAFTVR